MPARRTLALFVMTCSLTGGQTASPSNTRLRPNFSGTWKLNVLHSGPILPHGLTGLIIVIDHRQPSTVRVIRENMAGETNVTAIFGKDPPSIIDGREHVTRPGTGKTVRTTSQWSGDTLVTHQVYTRDGTDFISDTRTTLSNEGKILTIAEDYREPGLERIRDWVFEKQ